MLFNFPIKKKAVLFYNLLTIQYILFQKGLIAYALSERIL